MVSSEECVVAAMPRTRARRNARTQRVRTLAAVGLFFGLTGATTWQAVRFYGSLQHHAASERRVMATFERVGLGMSMPTVRQTLGRAPDYVMSVRGLGPAWIYDQGPKADSSRQLPAEVNEPAQVPLHEHDLALVFDAQGHVAGYVLMGETAWVMRRTPLEVAVAATSPVAPPDPSVAPPAPAPEAVAPDTAAVGSAPAPTATATPAVTPAPPVTPVVTPTAPAPLAVTAPLTPVSAPSPPPSDDVPVMR